MRLGKEQSAGYVEDIETEVTEPVPVTAAVPEPVLATTQPITVTR